MVEEVHAYSGRPLEAHLRFAPRRDASGAAVWHWSRMLFQRCVDWARHVRVGCVFVLWQGRSVCLTCAVSSRALEIRTLFDDLPADYTGILSMLASWVPGQPQLHATVRGCHSVLRGWDGVSAVAEVVSPARIRSHALVEACVMIFRARGISGFAVG